MKDNLGLFGHDDNTGEMDVNALREALKQNPGGTARPAPSVREQRGSERQATRQAAQVRRKRRRRSSMIAIVVLLLISGGAVYLISGWSKKPDPPADFTGAGTTETIVKIRNADGLGDIATTLLQAKVVASSQAFVQTATGNADIAAIRPGYYKVNEGASAQSAVDMLLDPGRRVGTVALIPGNTLGDTTIVKTREVLPGYVSQITKAACVPLNGVADCFTTDQLWQVVRTADVTELGLVSWAVDRVNKLSDPARRLEGMITPGSYDVPPGNDPVAVLKSVISASSVYWSTTNITTKATEQRRDPYDVAIIASLVERESITPDMPRVARVIDNRLAIPMKLQLDSTVNYWRAESQIATNDADRSDPANPYSTYAHDGLPPTPIGAIGQDALSAALSPAEGPWLYFVKIDLDGNSCFTVTNEDHLRCVAQAQANGVFG